MKTVRFRFIMTIGLAGTLSVIAPRAQEASRPRRRRFSGRRPIVVTIQASVRDASGRVLSGLTATDFEIRDNGEVRPILSLRSDRDAPLSVAILIDMSGSMQISDKIAMARQAFESVLVQLRSGRDEAARVYVRHLASRTHRVHERVEPAQGCSGRLPALRRDIPLRRDRRNGEATDATNGDQPRHRRAHRRHRHEQCAQCRGSLWPRELNRCAGLCRGHGGADRSAADDASDCCPRWRRILRDLADWSGGRLVFATTFTESVSVATNIVDELRQQYVLAIEAAPEREWRRLDVRVKTPAATVKARSGYFGG